MRGGLCYKLLARSLEEEIDCMFSDGEVRLLSPRSGIDLDHPFLSHSQMSLSLTSLFFFAKLNLQRFQKGFSKLVTSNSPNQIKKAPARCFPAAPKAARYTERTSPQPNPGCSHDALELSGLTVMCLSQCAGLREAESDAAPPPDAVTAVPEGEKHPKSPNS